MDSIREEISAQQIARRAATPAAVLAVLDRLEATHKTTQATCDNLRAINSRSADLSSYVTALEWAISPFYTLMYEGAHTAREYADYLRRDADIIRANMEQWHAPKAYRITITILLDAARELDA